MLRSIGGIAAANGGESRSLRCPLSNSRIGSYEYRKYWRELIEHHGPRCFYCGLVLATDIDHVIPYSHSKDNSVDNLVPACSSCNSIAGDRLFSDVNEKRKYILSRREEKEDGHDAVCSSCLMPFIGRIHSPSIFLCAECYDLEYGTKYTKQKRWKQWVIQLQQAGTNVNKHASARELFYSWAPKPKDKKMWRIVVYRAGGVSRHDPYHTREGVIARLLRLRRDPHTMVVRLERGMTHDRWVCIGWWFQQGLESIEELSSTKRLPIELRTDLEGD